jgi:type I restriction enzyme S subunit
LDLSELTYVDAETHAEIYARCPVEKGDVLYIKDGATTGLAINNPLSEPFSMLSSVSLLKPDRRLVDERYLKCWLNAPMTVESMTGQMTGSAIRRLTLTTIAAQIVPVPSLAEQKRIVAKIDALERHSRSIRSNLDRVPQLAERYKKAVLAAAFNGELTQDYRHVQSKYVRETLDKIRAERASGKLSGRRVRDLELYSRPARQMEDLPSGWEWVSIVELASDIPRSIQSGPFGSMLKHSEFVANGKLVIGIDNVLDGRFSTGSENRISDEKFAELSKYMARPGDVLITVMATVGRCCVVPSDVEPSIITKHVYRITPERRLVHPFFLMNALRGSEVVLSQLGAGIRGYTRPGINGEILKSVLVPIAPLDEQLIILDRIEAAFAWVDRLVSEVNSAWKLLDRLDQAILAKAFRGKLVSADPNDEPASVLLERIRAERATASTKGRRGRRAGGRSAVL